MSEDLSRLGRRLKRRLLGRALLWLAALGALLYIVRDQVGPVLTVVAGAILLSVGSAFVLGPILRRKAGRAAPADERLLRKRSFVIGLLVTTLGFSVLGVGVWLVVRHAIDRAF